MFYLSYHCHICCHHFIQLTNPHQPCQNLWTQYHYHKFPLSVQIICYHTNLVSLLFPYHHYSHIPIPKNHVIISPEFLLLASTLSTTTHLTSYGHPSRPIKSAMVFLRGATSAHIESGSDGVNLSWQSKGHTPPQEKIGSY